METFAALAWIFVVAAAWVLVPILLLLSVLAWFLKARKTASVILIAALVVWLQRAIIASIAG